MGNRAPFREDAMPNIFDGRIHHSMIRSDGETLICEVKPSQEHSGYWDATRTSSCGYQDFLKKPLSKVGIEAVVRMWGFSGAEWTEGRS